MLRAFKAQAGTITDCLFQQRAPTPRNLRQNEPIFRRCVSNSLVHPLFSGRSTWPQIAIFRFNRERGVLRGERATRESCFFHRGYYLTPPGI